MGCFGETVKARSMVQTGLFAVFSLDMPALHAYIVGMKTKHTQYTIRQVPPQVDRALRQRAREERRSLNAVALEALERGLGLAEVPVRYHDLDDLAGTWVPDPEFDRAVEEMDQVDPELWK